MYAINQVKLHIVFRIFAERSCFKIHKPFLWARPPSKPQGYLSGKPSNLESKVITSKHHDQQQEWAEQSGETVKWFMRGRETRARNAALLQQSHPSPSVTHLGLNLQGNYYGFHHSPPFISVMTWLEQNYTWFKQNQYFHRETEGSSQFLI